MVARKPKAAWKNKGNQESPQKSLDDAKNHQVEDLVSLDRQSRSGSCLRSKPVRKLEKQVKCTDVVFAKNTLMLKLEMKGMM